MKNKDYRSLYHASMKRLILDLPEEYDYIKDYFKEIESSIHAADLAKDDIGAYYERTKNQFKELGELITDINNIINKDPILRGTRLYGLIKEDLDKMENIL